MAETRNVPIPDPRGPLVSDDTHEHRCPNPKCGTIWSHTVDYNWSAEQRQQAHTCPACGAKQFFRYQR